MRNSTLRALAGLGAGFCRLGDAAGFLQPLTDAFQKGRDRDVRHLRAHGVPSRHGTTHARRAGEVERKLSSLMAHLPPHGSYPDRAAGLGARLAAAPDQGPQKPNRVWVRSPARSRKMRLSEPLGASRRIVVTNLILYRRVLKHGS